MAMHGKRALAMWMTGAMVCAAAGLAQAMPVQNADDFAIREGSGARRTALDKMERQPFPADAWSLLSEWTNGPAVSSGVTDGKVVVVVTWADWYGRSKPALSLAQRLAEKYSKDVVVVAVHHQEGWAEAKKSKASGDAQMLHALDAKGEFRAKLQSDQDPDFYIIDRAGQLRVADITTESVEASVDVLVKESRDVASSVNDRLAGEAKALDIERRRTDSIRQEISLLNVPEQAFEQPSAEEYKNVKWPPLPKDPDRPDEVPEPKQLALPEADWFPKKPEINGRMVITYFWHPAASATFGVFDSADQLQKFYGRDVVVVGVLTNFDNINGVKFTDDDKDPVKLRERLRKFTQSRNFGHYLVLDPTLSLLQSVTSEQVIPVPFFTIMSSDKQVRWWSSRSSTNAQAALLRILEADPGIQARRKAEAEYLAKQQDKAAGETPK